MEKFGTASTTASGSSRTCITNDVSSRFPGGAYQTIPFLTTNQFLRQVQPIDEATLPIPRIANKGQKYSFPFTFVIPDRLLPQACSHMFPVENDAVIDAHLRLPPSLGDLSVTGPDKDDMAPDMTRVTYAIHVQILRRREVDNKITILSDSSRKVAVFPICEDAPPAHIDSNSKDYRLQVEKDLRRGLLGGKFGRITVSAEQPRPVRVIPNCICPASITVPVSVTFVPKDTTTAPPELGSLTATLKTSTFFSTTKTGYIPSQSRSTPDFSVGNYTESTLLSSRTIAGVKWEKQMLPVDGKPVYKVQLVVPVTMPKGKLLVPSFSTCFITRCYTLDLVVTARTSNHSEPSMKLKLPLQVSNPEKRSQLDQGIDEFFVPRVISPSAAEREDIMLTPSGSPPEFQELQELQEVPPQISMLPPPGYSVFGSIGSVPQRIPEPVGISPRCG